MADATIAIKLTLEHEGGYQCDPDDHANWSGGQINEGTLIGTKYGITPQDIPGASIKDLTEDQATEYYREHYWKLLYSEIQNQEVANKLFDMGVLFGVNEAIKLLQITLQPSYPDVHPDGDFGPTTLARTNESDASSLLNAYKTSLVSYTLRIAVVKPNEKKFVAGWGNRINS